MKIFDAHFHIIDPAFPLFENNGYLPPPFTIEDYITHTKDPGLEITGGAIVSGSFQGFGQTYLIEALAKLEENFFGVANISVDVKRNELKRLNDAGVTAVRFNLKRGGSAAAEHLVPLSNRLYDEFGWHTELYADSKDLPGLKSKLSQIPLFSIDHLGLSKAGLTDVYRWVEKGMKVKATGFGRIDFDPLPVIKKIYEINPDALMFGTDLPSTRAKIPFSVRDLELIHQNFSEEAQKKILFQNAHDFYPK